MKIRVEHEDGRIETLTLKGDITISEGKALDRMRVGGMEHFFTKDGHYDGWGGAIEDSRRAQETIDEVEARRAFGDAAPDPRNPM